MVDPGSGGVIVVRCCLLFQQHSSASGRYPSVDSGCESMDKVCSVDCLSSVHYLSVYGLGLVTFCDDVTTLWARERCACMLDRRFLSTHPTAPLTSVSRRPVLRPICAATANTRRLLSRLTSAGVLPGLPPSS